jgi:hypothetical protein
MNCYHIEIIHSRGSTTYLEDRKVIAKSLSYSEAGCYTFYNEEGKPTAYYPIINTIITSIEYNIDL